MSGLRCKPNVSFDGLQPEGQVIRQVVEDVAHELGLDLTITCTTHDHVDGDPHTHGFALDIRTLDRTPEEIVKVFRLTWRKLGTDRYTVRFEVTSEMFTLLPQELKDIASINNAVSAQHLHVQVKKGLWQLLLTQRSTTGSTDGAAAQRANS